jgi:hypothetical protein
MRQPYDLQTMASSRRIRREAAEEPYAELVADTTSDEKVVGLVLGGSRGKRALVTPGSDYDAYVIVSDETAAASWRERLPTRRGGRVEATVFTLDEFRAHALPGSDTAWNRYSFAHVEVELDRLSGEIQGARRREGAARSRRGAFRGSRVPRRVR